MAWALVNDGGGALAGGQGPEERGREEGLDGSHGFISLSAARSQ